jgi:hypothetical protein
LSSSSEPNARIVFFASLFQGIGGAGALLTGRPAHAASAVISTPAARAAKINGAVRVARMMCLMANSGLLGLAIIEQPRKERRSEHKLAGFLNDG